MKDEEKTKENVEKKAPKKDVELQKEDEKKKRRKENLIRK